MSCLEEVGCEGQAGGSKEEVVADGKGVAPGGRSRSRRWCDSSLTLSLREKGNVAWSMSGSWMYE